MSRIGLPWRPAAAALVVAFASACLPGIWPPVPQLVREVPPEDACELRPVSDHWHLDTSRGSAVVRAYTCAALVEVNGDGLYSVGSPGTFAAEERHLTPFGVVSATNTEVSGEVFALDGVDPDELLALRPDGRAGTLIPLFAWHDPARPGEGFPEACRYFTGVVDDSCE